MVPVDLGEAGGGQHDVGLARADSLRNWSTAITVRAPASARVGEVAVGEVAERVGAEQHEHVDAAVGRGLRGCRVASRPGSAGTPRPRAGEPVAARRRG